MEPEAAFVGEPRRRSLEAEEEAEEEASEVASTKQSSTMEALLSGPPPPFPSVYALECPPSGSGEALVKPSTAGSGTASPFSYGGCFGGGYYSYRVARGSLKAPAPPQQQHLLYPEPCNAAAAVEEYQARPTPDLAFYPGYAAGAYHHHHHHHHHGQPSYLDVSVVQSLGNPTASAASASSPGEALLSMDPYHPEPPWALAGGWNNPQMCCPKESSPVGHFWKSAFAEAVVPHPGAEGCPFRRGSRKKRVPYSKGQLKELEKEYAGSKFITKDKRRRISAATNLTERQITIWFQNRRVKEKKGVAKLKSPNNPSNSSSSTTTSTTGTP